MSKNIWKYHFDNIHYKQICILKIQKNLLTASLTINLKNRRH